MKNHAFIMNKLQFDLTCGSVGNLELGELVASTKLFISVRHKDSGPTTLDLVYGRRTVL